MTIEFKETQRFNQWYLWILLSGVALIPVYGIYKQIFLEQQFGDKPMSDTGLVVLAMFTFGILILFWFMQLSTEIDRDEIRIRFFPFIKKRVAWKDVKEARVLNYGFVGGWGIRLGTRYGTVYNTSGRMGLAIVLINGRKFCVGTQKESELAAVVEKCMKAASPKPREN